MLDLAAVVRIGPEFSPAEQDRARAAAARDPRLRVALEAAGYGLTQTLAAAPQLVARWEDAQTASPYAWAVLTAALDAARLGARAPLSPDFLRAAAPGYCTSQQQAEAPENWFEQALAYATAKLHGAAAALSPAGAGMGQVVGYTVADYLIQHASRERRYARVPASTWDAVLSHVRDPADAARLADSARNRLLYCYAIPLYRHAADAGDGHAAWQLAGLLDERGDLDEADCAPGPTPATGRPPRAGRAAGRARRPGRGHRAARPGRRRRPVCRLAAGRAAGRARRPGRGRADTARPGRRGDQDAADSWPSCWTSAATWTGLQYWAVAGDGAATGLAELLAERGDLDGLRARADAGDEDAAEQLAELLAERGDLDGLRARADAGDGYAAMRLAELLDERGDLDGAARPGRRRRRTPPRSWPSAGRARRPGRSCAPGPTPATRTPPGGWPSCWPSAATWTELRARADAGDWHAAGQLAELLAERWTRPTGLRARADAGDEDAARQLAGLLAERGDLDGPSGTARPGRRRRRGRRRRLAGLLAKRGDLDGAEQILRARADAGDQVAARQLADLLPGAATWTSCAPGRRWRLAPHGSWPTC